MRWLRRKRYDFWENIDPENVISETRREEYNQYMRDHPHEEEYEALKRRYPFLATDEEVSLEDQLLLIEDLIAQGEEIGAEDHPDFPEARLLLESLRRTRNGLRRAISANSDSGRSDRGTPPV